MSFVSNSKNRKVWGKIKLLVNTKVILITCQNFQKIIIEEMA